MKVTSFPRYGIVISFSPALPHEISFHVFKVFPNEIGDHLESHKLTRFSRLRNSLL